VREEPLGDMKTTSSQDLFQFQSICQEIKCRIQPSSHDIKMMIQAVIAV